MKKTLNGGPTFGHSEKNLRAIIDGQPSGVVMIDRDGKIVLANAQLLADFRYTRDELIGAPIETLMPKRFTGDHPDHRTRYFREPVRRVMGVGRDLFALRKDGTEFPVEVGLNPIETDEGVFVLGSVVDITERKRIETELREKQREVAESEERLRRILDGQPNGMVMIDHSGRMAMVNARLEKDFGYSREELVGQKIELLVPKRFHTDHPRYRKEFFARPQMRAMGAGRDLFGQRKDGSEFPVELGLNPISIGDETFVVGSVVDITERKVAEKNLQTLQEVRRLAQSLEQRNRDIRALLDSVEQGFFTITLDGVMSEERSGVVDRWFGPPKPGMTLFEFLAQFDTETAAWIDLGFDQFRSQIIPADLAIAQMSSRFHNGKRTFAIDFSPIEANESHCLAVVIHDITAEVEREKLEAEQREILAIVSRIARDRSGFIEFYNEADEIVRALFSDLNDDLGRIKRRLHTLKGNASIFGLTRIEAICHDLESYLAEERKSPPKKRWKKLYDAWRSIQSSVQSVIGFKRKMLELSEAEYDGLLVDILSGKSHDELAIRLASWKLESTACYLERVAEQARALAIRLGKGPIEVLTHDHGLRIEPASWTAFWSSFVHVIRNAVDHGLEPTNERLQRDKPGTGQIELSTEISGDWFVISIRDDGHGIDWEHIAQIAAEKGLPHESEQDLRAAIFHDGLSSATSVTSISGRGIGMSAVKTACEALGGKIEIESVQHQGTEIRFSFPVESMAPHTTELLRLNPGAALPTWKSDTTLR
ncbi:MAG: PAS domain S-box protein [Planctomycetota bacterium]